MPTTLRSGPYRFSFWSQDCEEPRHTHVDRDRLSVKFWLDPDVRLAANHGFGRIELRRIERLVHEHVGELRYEWDRYCFDDGSS